jgi:hypothetical protein
MLLAFEADGEFKQVAEGAVLWTVGGDRIGRPLGGQIVLKKMAPGENRWIGLRIPIVTSKTGSRATVLVTEFVDGQPVSGFGLGTTRAPIAAVVNHALHRHRSVFARIATHFGDDRAQKEADAAATALARSPKRVSPKTFLTGLTKRVDDFVGVVKDVLQRCGGDRFDAGPALESFVAALQQGVVADTVVSQAALMECLDAAITELQLRAGNRADVLQNIHWQIDLLSGASALARLDRGARVVKPSAGFVDAWTKRTAGESAYVKLVQRLLPQLERIAQAAGLKNGPKLVDAIRKAGDDPTRVQGAHRNLLLALHGLAWPAVRVRPPRTPAVRSPAVKKPAKKATAKKATAKKSTKKATRRPRP